jgi:hypothetical protein
MVDEPRRSVRATKGQHTKTLDLMDQAEPTKKKSGKKTKKAAEVQEDAEVIRCVCGAVESPENDPEPWIACDSCGVWQHNVCVGVTTFDEDIPEKYLCEECDAVFHKDLLESLKRGVKIWEERRRLFEKEVAEEENGSKKKGKKKGKRISDSKPEAGNTVNGKAVSPFTPVAADAKKKDIKTGSIKRKVRDELNDKDILKVRILNIDFSEICYSMLIFHRSLLPRFEKSLLNKHRITHHKQDLSRQPQTFQ